LTATAESAADDGGSNERTWLAAANAATELNNRIGNPQIGSDLSEWESLTSGIAARLQKIRVPYENSVVDRQVKDMAAGRAADYQALRSLLRGPMLPGVERKRVWEAAQAIGFRIHKQTRDADIAADDALRPPGANRSPEPPLKDEAKRRERRAQVSIGLLRVAGLENVAELDKRWKAALADPKQWDRLAADCRTAWTESLPRQAKISRDKQDWSTADRRERFLGPDQVSSGRPAAVEIRRRDQGTYLEWLEGYYRSLGRLRQAAPRASAFYEDAAEEIRRARGD